MCRSSLQEWARSGACALVLAVVAAGGCREDSQDSNSPPPSPQTQQGSSSEKKVSTPTGQGAVTGSQGAKGSNILDKARDLVGSKPSLAAIAGAAKTWMPAEALVADVGKPMPNFSLIDLSGRQHTLGAYQGKPVMVVVWAPWCPPCRAEIPDLSELRRSLPEAELVVLSVSFTGPENTEGMIRQFVEQNAAINYPVIPVLLENAPVPLNRVEGIPGALFIGPDGVLRLATQGVVPLADMKAILAAL